MNDTAMTIRTNKDVKNKAQRLFADLGLDMSTAINIFLRQAVREDGIPFRIVRDEPNEETYQAIEEAVNDKNMVGPFDTVEELMESLHAED